MSIYQLVPLWGCLLWKDGTHSPLVVLLCGTERGPLVPGKAFWSPRRDRAWVLCCWGRLLGCEVEGDLNTLMHACGRPWGELKEPHQDSNLGLLQARILFLSVTPNT